MISKIVIHDPELGPDRKAPLPVFRRTLGAGDAVALISTPIARVLGLPCVDPSTSQLRPESPCAKRKRDWNALLPNLNPLAVDKPQK